MFSPGIKGNHRYNGIGPSVERLVVKDRQKNNRPPVHPYTNGKPTAKLDFPYNAMVHCAEVKAEPVDQDLEDDITAHSIIGIGEENNKLHKPPADVKPRIKRGSIRATHHETLQRIDVDEDVHNFYQQHWFSASLEKLKLEDRSREERIEITRHEFRRHIQQLVRSNLGHPNKLPAASRRLSAEPPPGRQPRRARLVSPKACAVEGCGGRALPCARHCTMHITRNADQVLFECSTAKFADNTQCAVPVFDVARELPLCAEHARKRDNYQLYQEAKPKKLRKKVKPSAMIRPQKRNKKKRRPSSRPAADSAGINPVTSSGAILVDDNNAIADENVCLDVVVDDGAASPELIEEEELQMVDQVLGLNDEPGLAHQVLEETDISRVLSTIQVDEFNDFILGKSASDNAPHSGSIFDALFDTVNRNGEYEPSREEAEELEKALAAVDNDVKSLEKLSQSQGLLDSLLDEHVLAETLVQIPEMFHNGESGPSAGGGGGGSVNSATNSGNYAQCGDSVVAQTAQTFLMPVEPRSHS